MTIQQAIEKAIKGGYRGKILDYFLNHNNEVIDTTNRDVLGTLLIDPLFWRCLGTAMGWKDLANKNFDIYELRMNLASKTVVQKFTETWRWQMHLFIGHLAEGKSVESFFANL